MRLTVAVAVGVGVGRRGVGVGEAGAEDVAEGDAGGLALLGEAEDATPGGGALTAPGALVPGDRLGDTVPLAGPVPALAGAPDEPGVLPG